MLLSAFPHWTSIGISLAHFIHQWSQGGNPWWAEHLTRVVTSTQDVQWYKGFAALMRLLLVTKDFFCLPLYEFAFWFRDKKVKYRVNALCSTCSHPTCAHTVVYHQVPHETDSGGSVQYMNNQLWLLDIGNKKAVWWAFLCVTPSNLADEGWWLILKEIW